MTLLRVNRAVSSISMLRNITVCVPGARSSAPGSITSVTSPSGLAVSVVALVPSIESVTGYPLDRIARRRRRRDLRCHVEPSDVGLDSSPCPRSDRSRPERPCARSHRECRNDGHPGGKSANLRLQGNGQGAVSPEVYLAQLPALVDHINAGTIALKANPKPLADVEKIWVGPDPTGQASAPY